MPVPLAHHAGLATRRREGLVPQEVNFNMFEKPLDIRSTDNDGILARIKEKVEAQAPKREAVTA